MLPEEAVQQDVVHQKTVLEEAAHTSSSEAPAARAEADQQTPRGTLTILLGYILVIIGLWGYAYVTMILRS